MSILISRFISPSWRGLKWKVPHMLEAVYWHHRQTQGWTMRTRDRTSAMSGAVSRHNVCIWKEINEEIPREKESPSYERGSQDVRACNINKVSNKRSPCHFLSLWPSTVARIFRDLNLHICETKSVRLVPTCWQKF